MEVFWSLLLVALGIVIVYSVYKGEDKMEDGIYEKSINFKGYIGGIAFIAIGIITLLKGW